MALVGHDAADLKTPVGQAVGIGVVYLHHLPDLLKLAVDVDEHIRDVDRRKDGDGPQGLGRHAVVDPCCLTHSRERYRTLL